MTKQTEKQLPADAPVFNRDNAMPTIAAEQANNRGNENVNQDTLVIPRLRLLQQGSPEIKKSRDEYIDGAEMGMWHNSATGEVYTTLYAVNLYFKVEYVVFDNDSFGADGFIGVFQTKDEAERFIASEEPEDLKRLKGRTPVIRESHNHFLMLIGPTGQNIGLVRLDCIKSRIKKSNLWNTQIAEVSRLENGKTADRFASVWQISSGLESNSNGEWYNLKTTYAGNAPESIYKAALSVYEATVGYFGAPTAAPSDAE